MKRLISLTGIHLLLLQGIALCASVSPAQSVTYLPFGTNYSRLGDRVDKHGYPVQKFLLTDLVLDDGLALPLFVEFSTAPRSQSAHLGEFWSIPLLDSHAYRENKRTLRAIMPMGKEKYFFSKSDTPNSLGHNSDFWSGRFTGEQIELIHIAGWKLLFEEGWIDQLILKNNQKLKWRRTGDEVRKLTYGQGGMTVLKLDREAGGMLAIKVYDIEGDLVNTFDLVRDPIYGGIKQISQNGKVIAEFNRGIRKDLTPFLEGTFKGKNTLVEWDKKTRKIAKDESWTYQIDEKNKDTLRRPAMYRTNKENKVREGYFYSPSTGITEILRPDGKIFKEYQILTPGKNFKAVRRRVLIADKKQIELLKRSYDDQGNMISEKVFVPAMKLTQFKTFDSAGKLKDVNITGPMGEEAGKELAASLSQLPVVSAIPQPPIMDLIRENL